MSMSHREAIEIIAMDNDLHARRMTMVGEAAHRVMEAQNRLTAEMLRPLFDWMATWQPQ